MRFETVMPSVNWPTSSPCSIERTDVEALFAELGHQVLNAQLLKLGRVEAEVRELLRDATESKLARCSQMPPNNSTRREKWNMRIILS